VGGALGGDESEEVLGIHLDLFLFCCRRVWLSFGIGEVGEVNIFKA